MHSTLENATGDIMELLNKLGNIYYSVWPNWIQFIFLSTDCSCLSQSFIERQSKTDAENENLLSGFRAELDHGLRVLHDTVIGSVCEQNKILESINEQTKLYFLARTEVTLLKCYAFMITIPPSTLKELQHTIASSQHTNWREELQKSKIFMSLGSDAWRSSLIPLYNNLS